MSATPSMLGPGSKVGRFVVVGELGSGGMGVVYAAHDRELDRQVALKVMRTTTVGEEDRLRMLREGQAMARVTHANVITVYEVGTEDGSVFLAQELLDGGTLGQWLETPRAQEQIVAKFVAAGRGLAAAHAAGLVHRDFKPDNVLLGKDGRVRVADFGLARAIGSDLAMLATVPGGGGRREQEVALSQNLTRTGVVMGTPMFMAPEQHEGKPADARSDQFAFCVALYQAVYGDWPFDGKTAVALADNVINGVMKKPPIGSKVPTRLRQTLLRGLATDPDARFPSMEALLAELTQRAPSRSKLWLVAAGAAVTIAGAAASISLLGRKPAPQAPAPPPAPPVVEPTPLVEPAPGPARDLDPRALTNALDLGQLDTARQRFDDDARLIADPAKQARARASAALMLVLGGELVAADGRIKDIGTPSDPIASGYADMAAAALAFARGDLAQTVSKSQRCVTTLGTSEPIAASICYQLLGDGEAERGNAAAAHAAYTAGTQLAARDAQRLGELALASAQLELDEKQENVSLDAITTLKKDARRRGAVSCEATAAVLAARMRLAKADTQGALDVFDDVDPDRLQAYRTRAVAKLTIGQVYGYRNEADDHDKTGLEIIDEVIADAQRRGYHGLVLEGRLAKVLVLLVTSADGANDERAKLIEDAKAKGFSRIATLAAVDLGAAPADPMPAEVAPPQ